MYNPPTMSKNDTLQRFIFENKPIRGVLIHLSASFSAITSLHAYPESINNLLGEALASAAILCSGLKTEGRLTVQFQGTGAVKLLTASCTHENHLRGLAEYDDTADDMDLTQALKAGKLAITFTPDKGKPYQGIVDIEHGAIPRAIETYLTQSEQLQSRLFLHTTATNVSGLFLQVLPGPKTENDIEHIMILAETLTEYELATFDNATLLHRLFHEENIRLFDEESLSFRCTCSRERSENAIRLMGKSEINAILRENHVVDVCCEFCNAHYVFKRLDVENIFGV